MNKLFTQIQLQQLLENGNDENYGKDHYPVVKLFTPDANCTWLLTDLSPEDQDTLFGLCDLGMGFPEIGSVSLTELKSLKGRLGLPVERDIHFEAKAPISVYAEAARSNQHIVEDKQSLKAAAERMERYRKTSKFQP